MKEFIWGIQDKERIQKIKSNAFLFRNRERVKDALLFHLGGLDLMPTQAKGCWFTT
jgi:hypothetical protein